MVKLAKAASKQSAQKKKAPPPPKEVEEESSEEESSEEEEAPPAKAVKKATPAKAVKNGTAAKKAESEDDDSEESEEEAPPPKKTPAKSTPAKPAPAPAKAEESDDDDDEDDEESEEEAPPPKKAAKPAKGAAKPPVKAKPAKEPSDDEDDEDDDSEEEAPPPKKATPAKPAAKAAKAKPAKDDDDDEDDDGEDDSEEDMDTTPAQPASKAKKAGMVKAKEESEEEEEDDDEDDEEEEEDDDDETPVTPGKRKADSKKDTPPAKKAKAEGEGFCLFVGNLNSNKDFDEIKSSLRKFFSKNSLEVADVRLGGSKKFGYVEFESEEDMQKAMELNGKKLMGQELKLDRARSKDTSQEGKKERDARTLFIKNLPFSATPDDLKEIFEDAVDVRLPQGQNGSNRGIAYVEFKSEAEAEKMLEEAQGADVQGRSIMVDYVGEKSQKGAKVAVTGGGGGASKTLVVNNLSFSATEEVLQSTFEKAVSIRIPQRDGRPKGFAFVEFESADDAKDALENLNNSEIEGRTIRLEYSQNSGGRDGGRGNSGPTKTLFVKGLSEDTTDQTLKDAFEGAHAARIVTDRDTGSSKGFGFVDFDNEDDCKAAKEAMDNGEIDGTKVTLDYAKPKGEGGFRGGRGGGGFGGGGFGGRGGGRGRGGFGGGFGGRGGGRGRGGFGGRGGGGRGGRGGFGGGRGGGGFGAKPQGKKIKFDD
ncbi:putative nucleolin [Scophthalmus maximus]|uniref:Nucleolin n=1 Tax=Scophthalmus maximus TaxID=52904 RepID=A0A2U9C542_SCOMX|nr:nucleolin [Scophthalmus maximus]AWP10829.1 putative nucleolin [Scophthalmus maximus]